MVHDLTSTETDGNAAKALAASHGGEVCILASRILVKVASVEIESRPVEPGKVLAGHMMRVRVNGKPVAVRSGMFSFRADGLPRLSLDIVPMVLPEPSGPQTELERLREEVESLRRELAERGG